jgi:5-methylcytosine-specific restriction endonuclease McrA
MRRPTGKLLTKKRLNLYMRQSTELKDSVCSPIPELFVAAKYLDAALSAHMIGNFSLAKTLLKSADMEVLREWTESHWGANTPHKEIVFNDTSVPFISKKDRISVRMPSKYEKARLHKRDRFHCRFCGVPVIRKEVRDALKGLYPDEVPWGRRNREQHAGFQALWLQYDHVLPHARGGDNSIDNMVITCAPCNYVRMDNLVIEMGVSDPFSRDPINTNWDGLERLLRHNA